MRAQGMRIQEKMSLTVADAGMEAWGDMVDASLAEEVAHPVSTNDRAGPTTLSLKRQNIVADVRQEQVADSAPSPVPRQEIDPALIEVQYPIFGDIAILRHLKAPGGLTAETTKAVVQIFHEDIVGNFLFDGGVQPVEVKLTGRSTGSTGLAVVRLSDASAVARACALSGTPMGVAALAPLTPALVRQPVASRPFAQPKSFKEAAALAAGKPLVEGGASSSGRPAGLGSVGRGGHGEEGGPASHKGGKGSRTSARASRDDAGAESPAGFDNEGGSRRRLVPVTSAADSATSWRRGGGAGEGEEDKGGKTPSSPARPSRGEGSRNGPKRSSASGAGTASGSSAVSGAWPKDKGEGGAGAGPSSSGAAGEAKAANIYSALLDEEEED